jgi:hypothetical protein
VAEIVKKIYTTDSGRFLPFLSFAWKKVKTSRGECPKATGMACLLTSFIITLKNVQL